jgi:hypothetical protein
MPDEDAIVVELRSDTFTKPSRKMREAMMNADVGDSSYNEDPTITSRPWLMGLRASSRQ